MPSIATNVCLGAISINGLCLLVTPIWNQIEYNENLILSLVYQLSKFYVDVNFKNHIPCRWCFLNHFFCTFAKYDGWDFCCHKLACFEAVICNPLCFTFLSKKNQKSVLTQACLGNLTAVFEMPILIFVDWYVLRHVTPKLFWWRLFIVKFYVLLNHF